MTVKSHSWSKTHQCGWIRIIMKEREGQNLVAAWTHSFPQKVAQSGFSHSARQFRISVISLLHKITIWTLPLLFTKFLIVKFVWWYKTFRCGIKQREGIRKEEKYQPTPLALQLTFKTLCWTYVGQEKNIRQQQNLSLPPPPTPCAVPVPGLNNPSSFFPRQGNIPLTSHRDDDTWFPPPVISSLAFVSYLDSATLCWKSVIKVKAPRVLPRRRSLGSDIRWKFHSMLRNKKIKLLWVGACEDVLSLEHFCCFLWNFLLRRRPACWIGFCFLLLQEQDGL